jgi:predicted outer membrane protein
MTLTEKLLLRFCSTEVQTMLQRLRERPEDFAEDTRMYGIIRHEEYYTLTERGCIAAAWKFHKENEGRRKLLNAIMSQLINPKKRYE